MLGLTILYSTILYWTTLGAVTQRKYRARAEVLSWIR